MKSSIQQNTRVIQIEGPILRKDAEELNEEFSQIELGDCPRVILDLTQVNHVCSSALGVFVSYKRKLRNRNGELKLIITDEDLRQVFEITMLDKVFEIYTSLQDALQSFEKKI